MIRIKAPRLWRSPSGYTFASVRMGAAPGRFYSEAMHRRVVALVRACESDVTQLGLPNDVHKALCFLREQAEKEAK